jgi:hypothetical protein
MGGMGGPPNMGGMPPNMGGMPPNMGGMQQQQQQQMMRPVRRGTSKAVPVVVSAGLAVGVFCGLLFGIGTGTEATGAPATNANKIAKDDGGDVKADPGAAPQGLGATSTVNTPPKPAAGSGAGSAAPTAGSGAGSAAPAAAGAGAGSAKPAVVEAKVIKVTLDAKPADAMKDAKVKVDGKDVAGITFDIPVTAKSFKVEVKANGYRTYENKFNVVPDLAEMSVQFDLVKRPAAGTGVRPPKRPGTPPSAGGGGGGGGLIDI